MDARTKALKAHRKRLRTRRMKRVEVTVRDRDAALVRQLAEALRGNGQNAERLRLRLHDAITEPRQPNLAEALHDSSIAGPEFDEVFEEIERFRHHPTLIKVRDVDFE